MTATTTVTEASPPITHGKYFKVSIPVLTLELGFFTQVSGFSAQLDVLEYPEGGINNFVHRLPSRIKQGNITLKRGITSETALLAWFEQTVTALKVSDMSIQLLDYQGKQPIQTWA